MANEKMIAEMGEKMAVRMISFDDVTKNDRFKKAFEDEKINHLNLLKEQIENQIDELVEKIAPLFGRLEFYNSELVAELKKDSE